MIIDRHPDLILDADQSPPRFLSSEEWEWLQESSARRDPAAEEDGDVTPMIGVTSPSQGVTSRFRAQVETAVRRLLKLMDVPAEQAANHR